MRHHFFVWARHKNNLDVACCQVFVQKHYKDTLSPFALHRTLIGTHHANTRAVSRCNGRLCVFSAALVSCVINTTESIQFVQV